MPTTRRRNSRKSWKKIDRATEKASQKIDAAKESLDQKTSEAGEYIDESADASREGLEKAGEKIDQTTEAAGKELESAKEALSEKAETTGAYIDDSMITAKVKAAFLADPLLKAFQIEVTTVDGIVKLSGTVDSEQSIGRAVELAKSQENVKSVATDLIVNVDSRSNE
nr:BON domain-containing protein [Methylomarinum sp. Ch1-1]MDP4519781.1 BON domain-containing protein [Methylomarinum sp. Ch1-1]